MTHITRKPPAKAKAKTKSAAKATTSATIAPPDGTQIPRYAGANTFCRLPELRDVARADVAVIGIPYDSGTSFRPGARFGPQAIRQASRHLRTNYHPAYAAEPFATNQCADGGDIACNPFNIGEAMAAIEEQATAFYARARHLIALGGDHSIALPLLRCVNQQFGKVALVHFDAHLDTWDTYFGEPCTHGTPFRRAAEEGLFCPNTSMHIGIRGPLYSRQDLVDDADFGFKTVHCDELQTTGFSAVVTKIKKRVGKMPVYLSIDIDVLDPAHAPGTGTPEVAGLSSRELVNLVRAFAGLQIVGADIVEVAPAYDHAEITALAAATLAYEMCNLFAVSNGSGSARATRSTGKK